MATPQPNAARRRAAKHRRAELSRAAAGPSLESLEQRCLLAGTGLTATYFDNTNFTTPKLTRVDPAIDFNWGTVSPDPSLAADTFSVRWTGQVQATASEAYTFHVTADDGVRLWVNDNLIITNWMNQSARELTGRINLRAGERYDIKLEYFDATGNASAKLAWSSPSTAKQVIPQSQLYPTSTWDDRGGLVEETWNNIPGSTIASLTSDVNYPNKPSARKYINSFESIAQSWADNYGRRVRGYIVAPMTGAFQFAVSGDESVELYLSTDASTANASRIAYTSAATSFRNFTQAATQQSASINLVQGQKYYVELRQKENTGSDSYSVAWKTPIVSSYNVIDGGSLAFWNSGAALPAAGSILANLSTARPRLIGTQEMFEASKSLIQSGGQFTTWYNALKTAANAVVTRYADVTTTLAYPGPSATQAALAPLMDDLSALAGAYKLVSMVDGVAAATVYADKAIAMMKRAVAADWANWDGGNQALGIGMAAQGFALCYDWMNAAIGAADKQTIADGLMRLAIRPVSVTLNAKNYWVGYNNNWVFVVAGGTTSAALAIANDAGAVTSEIETFISRSVPAVKTVMGKFAANNGGWNEGPGYQGYGGMHLFHMLASLETSFGTDFGLSRTPGFEGYVNFVLYQTSPQTKQTYYFGDGAWSQNGDAMNFWLARRFNRPELAAAVRPLLSTSARATTFLYYDTRGASPGTVAAPTDFSFDGDQTSSRSEHVATFRDSWNNIGTNGASVMVKGGYDGDNNHDHLDTGSFLFDANGYRWAEDVGNESYAIPMTAGTLFNTYRRRAEGQNTLVINPTANDYKSSADTNIAALNADQVYDSTADAPIIRQLSTDRASVAIVDMTSTYAKMRVQKVQRGFYFDRNDDSLLIQDEIAAANPAEIYWAMHFRYAPGNTNYVEHYDISGDGKTVSLWRGTQRLYVQILSGKGTFEVDDATPLASSPNPAGQASNSGFKKLVIHMTNVTNERLSVWMVPLAAGQSPPASTPSVTPLATWYPPQPRRVWVGDVDQYQRDGVIDDVSVDADWKLNAIAAAGKPRAGFDVVGANQVVPFTVNLNLQPGETITSAKLVVALRAQGAASTASDRLYIDDTANSFSYAQLGWGTIDATPVAREFDLSSQLSRLQDGTLNLAFAGSTGVDWASVIYETSLSSTLAGDAGQANQDDVFRLVRNGTFAEVYQNGASTPAARWAIDATLSAPYEIDGLGGNDSLIIDMSGGDPMPLAGLRFDGGIGSNTATLTNAPAGVHVILDSGLSINGSLPFDLVNVGNVVLNLGANQLDALSVSAPALTATALRVNVATGGRVTLATGTVLPAFSEVDIASGGTFDLGGLSQSIDKLTGGGTLTAGSAAATLTIGAAGGSSTFSGSLANGASGQTLSLTKAGAGTTILGGAGTFSGGVRINAGSLRAANSSALGTTAGGVYITGGTSTGRLELAGGVTIADAITLEAKAADASTGIIPPHLVNISGNNVLAGAIELVGGGTGQAVESQAGLLTINGAINRSDTAGYHRPFQLRGAGDGIINGNLTSTSATGWGLSIQKTDAGTWTLGGTVAVTGPIAVTGGRLRLNGVLTQTSGVTVGGAALDVATSQTWPSLTIAAGGVASLLGSGGTTLGVRSLSIAGGSGAWSGTLDLRDGAVVVDYAAGASPLAVTTNQIATGRAGGAWNGFGIISSTRPATGTRGVGLAEAAALFNLTGAATSSFYGMSVDASAVVITATLAGDTNLDRKVDFSDLLVLAQNYGATSGAAWTRGDTDLDGDVDFADLLAVAQSYGLSTGLTATVSAPTAQAAATSTKRRATR